MMIFFAAITDFASSFSAIIAPFYCFRYDFHSPRHFLLFFISFFMPPMPPITAAIFADISPAAALMPPFSPPFRRFHFRLIATPFPSLIRRVRRMIFSRHFHNILSAASTILSLFAARCRFRHCRFPDFSLSFSPVSFMSPRYHISDISCFTFFDIDYYGFHHFFRFLAVTDGTFLRH
jgi:hypothetical protein